MTADKPDAQPTPDVWITYSVDPSYEINPSTHAVRPKVMADAQPTPRPIREDWDSCEGAFSGLDGSLFGRYRAGEILMDKYEALERALAAKTAELAAANERADKYQREFSLKGTRLGEMEDRYEAERAAREQAERKLDELILQQDMHVLVPIERYDALEAAEQRLAAVEAKLAGVAQAERERCAKVCEELTIPTEWFEGCVRAYRVPTSKECAAAIRALAAAPQAPDDKERTR